MKCIKIILATTLLGIFCSCSSDDSEKILTYPEIAEQNHDLFFSCKEEEEGNIKYSVQMDNFYQCSKGTWRSVSITIVGPSSSENTSSSPTSSSIEQSQPDSEKSYSSSSNITIVNSSSSESTPSSLVSSSSEQSQSDPNDSSSSSDISICQDGDVLHSFVDERFSLCKNGKWVEYSSSSSKIDSCHNGDILFSDLDSSFHICQEGKWVDYEISSSSTEPDSLIIECDEGDKLLSVIDSSYHQCLLGKWVDLDEIWIITKDTNTYLTVRQGRFLPDAGFYSPFTLRPPKSLYGGTVRCTFDGSEPTIKSANVTENTFIGKTTTIRCTEFLNSSAVATNTETYFIDEDINMPVFSISASPAYVKKYIKAEPCTPDPCYSGVFWEDVEYPAHIEYFDNGSKAIKKDFEVDAGLSIAGGWSRNFLKKSVSITLRDEYQKGRIKFPLFGVRPENSTFKSIKLRNNGNRFISDYICDPMATSLLEGTNVDYQRSRQVVAFFNGEFYGIYDMREKLNEHFIETNYGIPNNQVEVIEQTMTRVNAIHGNVVDYQEMLQFAGNNDLSDTTEAYETIREMVDIDNLVDYMAAEMYYHNGDWPQNNVKAWRTLNRPWRFMAFDIDHGFDWSKRVAGFKKGTNMLEWVLGGGKPETSCANGSTKCFVNLFVQLFKNPVFKRLFINRSVVLYAEFINSTKISEAVDRMVASIDPNVITRDLELFPRDSFAYKSPCQVGFDPYGTCLKEWSIAQDSIIREQFRAVLGLGEDIHLTFNVEGNGKIRMEDFDLPKSNYTGTFYANFPILLTAIANDKSVAFKSWSDGSTENPRIIEPSTDSVFVAQFENIE